MVVDQSGAEGSALHLRGYNYILVGCRSIDLNTDIEEVNMSSLKSISRYSSSDSSSKKDPENHLLLHEPFPEAITKCPELKCILNVTMNYDIFLGSSGKHWYLMVHCNVEGGDFPYITFEITSNIHFEGKMIPTMKIIPNDVFNSIVFKEDIKLKVPVAVGVGIGGGIGSSLGAAIGGGVGAIMMAMAGQKPTLLDTRKTTLMELCKTAEKVRCGMGEYNLLKNNGQHFCNNVLEELGLPTTPTTVGPITTEVEDMDDVNPVFKQVSGEDGGEKGT